MIGIYKIQNKINGRIYIGQSRNIYARWAQHEVQESRTGRIFALEMDKMGSKLSTFDKYLINSFTYGRFNFSEKSPMRKGAHGQGANTD